MNFGLFVLMLLVLHVQAATPLQGYLANDYNDGNFILSLFSTLLGTI